jgi:hypothetical protein
VRPDQVRAWISDARFHAFLEASGQDHGRAVALYNWNAEVSAAFLEVLYHLEILLRNAIDHQFPATASDASLSICVAEVWLCDPGLLTDESRERVNGAIQDLEKKHREQLELAGLIDAEARHYIAALSRVNKLLLERP